MDDSDVFETISSTRQWQEEALALALKILASHENALGDVPALGSPELRDYLNDFTGTYEVCREIGEAIQDYLVKAYQRASVHPDRERTLADCLTARMLGTVSWNDVGMLFFRRARENYAYRVAELMAAAEPPRPGGDGSGGKEGWHGH